MEYKVESTDKPTFFNKDTAIGLFAGFLAALVIPPVAFLGMTAATAGLVIPLIGAGVAAVAGSIIGKTRMNRELEEGKVVKEPTIFNKKTLIGAMAGLIGGALIGTVVAAVLAAPALGLAAATVASASAIAFVGGQILGALGGAIIGGRSGKKEMRREYEAASVAQAQQDQLLAAVRAKQLEQAANGTLLPENAQGQQTQNQLPPSPDMRQLPPAPEPKLLVAGDETRQLPPAQPQPGDVTISLVPAPGQPTQAPLDNTTAPAPVTVIAAAPPQNAPTAISDTALLNAGQAIIPTAPVTVVESQPVNNTTVITAAENQAPPQPETHTHNITTNTYVIAAMPPQAVQPAQDAPPTITNTVIANADSQPAQLSMPQNTSTTLAAADSQPANTQITKPENTNGMLVASAEPPAQAPAQAPAPVIAADAKQPATITITISADGSQPVVISGQPDGADKSFTAQVVGERTQNGTTQDKKSPTASYAANVTTERNQQGTQVNTV